jgi:hypothetical protein
MDFKTRVLRIQRDIQENPAGLALVIIIVVAIVFISAIFLDSYITQRKRKKLRRGKTPVDSPPVH